MKISVALTKEQANKIRLKCDDSKKKGIFLRFGSDNVVDRIVGYHFKRGFIADYCYYTRNHWLKDLFLSLFKYDTGFVTLTSFI